MAEAKVKILSNEEIDKRFPIKDSSSNEARKAIEEGFSIAVLEKEGLRKKRDLASQIDIGLEAISKTCCCCKIIDLSELEEDKIYFAFK